MADRQFVIGGIEAAPADWVLPAALEITPKTAYATFDGTNAAGAFLPCLEIISDSGHVVGLYVVGEPVAAGGSAVVSWFPGGELDTQAQTPEKASGISAITSSAATLAVTNPSGPSTNLDLPASGVAAGTYGDSSHSAELTVNAEGIITSVTQVGIAGGSGTIGFEIGYDPITAAVNIGSTSEATATTIITCSAHTFDGAPVLLTVFFPYIQTGSSGATNVTTSLWESTTEITRLGFISYGPGAAILAAQTMLYRFTPSAGSHTYIIKAHAGTLTGTPQMGAGSGSGANYPPAFARFTKV